MKYLHTMVRVRDLEKSLWFYGEVLGLKESRRVVYDEARFTLVYLTGKDSTNELELTYNWDEDEVLEAGRSFGHIAYEVDDIYKCCQRISDLGVIINRPPRDGKMAFIKSPDGISIELLQKDKALDIVSPWQEMKNIGSW